MSNDVAPKPKPSISVWLLVTLGASFVCMVAAASVMLYARFSAPSSSPPSSPPVDIQVRVQEDPDEADLKEIDKTLSESAQLFDDIRRKEQELRARLALSQAVPSVRVAAIQFASEFGNVVRNRERLTALIRLAAGNGARLIVIPECAITGYMSVDHKTAWRDPVRRPNPKDGRSIVEAGVADTVPGENTKLFGKLAKELNVYLVITLIERVERVGVVGSVPPVDYYNTAVLLGPDEKILCHYRKLNLWPPGDATWAQAGDRGLGLCDTPFGKLGLLICYDLSSGVVTRLKDAGATMILYPVGWVHPKPPEDWFEKMLPEKVKDWGLPVIAANWSVDELPKAGDAFGYGFSSIYGSDGTVLSGAGPDGSEVICADLPAVVPDTTP
jgi:predicted amidohydrolase